MKRLGMGMIRHGTLVLMMMLIIRLHLTNLRGVAAGPIDAARKISKIIETYDKRLRPYAGGPPLNVSVQIVVIAFGPVDEKSLTFKADLFLRQAWYDPRLEKLGDDILNYNGDPSDAIWVVDTFFPNARDSKLSKTLTPNIRTKLGPKGNVYTSSRLNIECTCPMDLHLYPMDVQECSMLMESFSYTGKDVTLLWIDSEKPIEIVPGGMQLSGYEFTDLKKEYIVRTYYNKETFPLLKATFQVTRTFSYYLFRLYLPTSLLVALTWATFWIPDKAVPARITLIVTNFLSTTFILQSAATNIPKVSYTTALEVYLFTNVLFIIAVMVEYVLVLNFCQKIEASTDEKKPKQKIKLKDELIELKSLHGKENKMFTPITSGGGLCSKCKICRSLLNNDCHLFDAISRIMFPLVYCLFIIIYSGYYATRI